MLFFLPCKRIRLKASAAAAAASGWVMIVPAESIRCGFRFPVYCIGRILAGTGNIKEVFDSTMKLISLVQSDTILLLAFLFFFSKFEPSWRIHQRLLQGDFSRVTTGGWFAYHLHNHLKKSPPPTAICQPLTTVQHPLATLPPIKGTTGSDPL